MQAISPRDVPTAKRKQQWANGLTNLRLTVCVVAIRSGVLLVGTGPL